MFNITVTLYIIINDVFILLTNKVIQQKILQKISIHQSNHHAETPSLPASMIISTVGRSVVCPKNKLWLLCS